MKQFIGCLLAVSLLATHLFVHGETLQRSFQIEHFVGLTSLDACRYDDVTLDYELDRREGGSIHFDSCIQVDAISEGEILESQYALFKLLSMNCHAFKRCLSSASAQKSFFSPGLTKEIVATFPATATVLLSEEDVRQRSGKTLADYEHKLDIAVSKNGAVRVLTTEDELSYQVLARADFDGDGAEDMLVRVDWHARKAMGKGTDLVLLSKPSHAVPITVIWRADS